MGNKSTKVKKIKLQNKKTGAINNPIINPMVFYKQEDSNNGSYFCNYYMPDEVLTLILSYVDAEQLIHCSEVCIKWYKLIKDKSLWKLIYERHIKEQARNLPWYVYYSYLTTEYWDKNLILNPNGENNLNYWQNQIGWTTEKPPRHVKPLPNAPELNESCFSTSHFLGTKNQVVHFEQNNLLCTIINIYKPMIYVSDWYVGCGTCECEYNLEATLADEKGVIVSKLDDIKKYYGGLEDWKKIEISFANYLVGVKRIIFKHSVQHTQCQHNYCGMKVAGSVCKLFFNSIVSSDNFKN